MHNVCYVITQGIKLHMFVSFVL